jgi:MFS family permease
MMRDSRLDGRAAWTRLAIALLISMIGSAPMWTVVVVLPTVQAEFGTLRAGASLPYTMTMVGFMVGGVLMGRLSDRFGVMVPVRCLAMVRKTPRHCPGAGRFRQLLRRHFLADFAAMGRFHHWLAAGASDHGDCELPHHRPPCLVAADARAHAGGTATWHHHAA